MTATAAQILEQAILRATAESYTQAGQGGKTIEDIAGKYRPQLSADTKNRDRGFAEAIAASKAECFSPNAA